MCQMEFNSVPWMPGTSTAANQCQGTLKLIELLLCVHAGLNCPCVTSYRMYVQWTCN